MEPVHLTLHFFAIRSDYFCFVVVARECRIPAVLQGNSIVYACMHLEIYSSQQFLPSLLLFITCTVESATRLIKTGQRITIDGDSGEVRLLID